MVVFSAFGFWGSPSPFNVPECIAEQHNTKRPNPKPIGFADAGSPARSGSLTLGGFPQVGVLCWWSHNRDDRILGVWNEVALFREASLESQAEPYP